MDSSQAPLPISLVINTATPATNSLPAIGILKIVLALSLNSVSFNLAKPSLQSKFPLWVSLPSGNNLYEPNSVIRFAYNCGSFGPAERFELDLLLEWEEKIITGLLETKDADRPQLISMLNSGTILNRIGLPNSPASIAVFSSIYDTFSSMTDETRASFPSVYTWFKAVSDLPNFSSAIKIYTENTKKLAARPAPSPENRKFNRKAEFFRDLSKVNVKPGEKNILITSALPYVNNIPHLGNIIGSVLSADVYARYCRARGLNTLYICGTDEYGTATETKAIEEKTTCQELCDKYHKIHAQVYNWFDISFDIFGRTTTPLQTEIVQDMFTKCYDQGYISTESMTQLFCPHHNKFLADRYVEGTCPKCGYEDARGDQCDGCGQLMNAAELIDPRCKLDGHTPIIKESVHLFLDLEKLQPDCEKFVSKSSKDGGWSPNGLTITRSWLNEGLRPRCITRDLEWGVPVPLPGFQDKVFYVWFDACIGYISITANYTDRWEDWWKNPDDVDLYQFMGKDNVPFHTVVFPSTQIATGEKCTMLHHISTTEYLNYESGKFSKSRGVGVFGNSAQETGIAPDVWRYFLLSNRPESSDTQFTWSEFIARNNNELLANLGNFCNRILRFVDATSKYAGALPYPNPESLTTRGSLDQIMISDINEILGRYNDLLSKVHIRSALRTAMEISARGNSYLQESKFDNALFTNNRAQCDTVIYVAVNLIYLLSAVVSPYMPQVSQSITIQLNAPARLIPDTFDLDLLPGHVIGKPSHLFSNIDESMADVWRAKYGGSQSHTVAE
ncbi:putative methionine-tRNA ligase, cytoplasmic [Smittium mucronatum]|uniref:methionine--tRNA ligase n=1 Tax=Smittium mucronatum TaxID=133383 RepID=A0A1R0GZQ6_9FUNG|nr:putative methionine-tRNA ligase, cytoplasmic [Smittium mucronatum]